MFPKINRNLRLCLNFFITHLTQSHLLSGIFDTVISILRDRSYNRVQRNQIDPLTEKFRKLCYEFESYMS